MIPGKDVIFPKIPGGTAKPASSDDLKRDKIGFTHPNLHRRIDPKDRETADPRTEFNPYEDVPQFEFAPRDYQFYISGYNSYRMTTFHTHDEDNTYWEIP